MRPATDRLPIAANLRGLTNGDRVMFRVPSSPLARRAALSAAVLVLAATVAACTTEGVMRPDALVGRVDTMQTAAYLPRVGNPIHADPSDPYAMDGQEADPYVMPAEEIACRQRLKKLGAVFTDVPRIGEGSGCGVAWPVQMTHLAKGRIELTNGATLNCAMAEAFASWAREELVPSSRYRYFSGVARITVASSYSCRWIKGRVGGTLSEHGKGNAIDVASITLNNGKEIDVRKPGFFAFREKGLLKKTRAEACQYFSTVLGPGYDYDHRDHFHFDLKERRNGRVACN